MKWNDYPVLGALALFTLFTLPVSAQEQMWSEEYADSGATGVASSGSGVFVGGWTTTKLGGVHLGHSDVFLANLTETGELRWMRQFGTAEDEWPEALIADGAGGAYIGGETLGNLGGPKVGYFDAFVTHFDAEGNHLWSRQFGSYGDEVVKMLASDGEGGVFAGGETDGSLGGPHAGEEDVFLARYDKHGNQLWLMQFGTDKFDGLTGLESDGMGGVYVGGTSAGGIGGPGTGLPGGYIAHFDGEGNELFVRQHWSGLATSIFALGIDNSGGLYVTGATRAHLQGTNAGKSDVFLAKLKSDGTIAWIRQFGTPVNDHAVSLVFDGEDSVYIGGQTQGRLGRHAFGGRSDFFLARFDTNGNLVWLRQFGSKWEDQFKSVAIDGDGRVYVCGRILHYIPFTFEHESFAYVAQYRDHGGDCYADCDESTGFGVLDVFDFLCFQNAFISSNSYACDCDENSGSGVCDIFDFVCFQDAFVAGCP